MSGRGVRGGAWIALALAVGACGSTLNPEQPRAYPCDPDAPAGSRQCPGEWRCGLDRLCHDPALGAPLACKEDRHCTGGWRCSAGGTCVDASATGLTSPAGPAPAATLVQPPHPAPPDVFAVNHSAGSYVRVDGAVLSVVEGSTVTQVPVMPPVTSAQITNSAVYLVDRGGLGTIPLGPKVLDRYPEWTDGRGQAVASGGDFPVVAVFTPGAEGIRVIRRGGTLSPSVALRVNGVGSVIANANNTRALLAVGERGMFAAARSTSGNFLTPLGEDVADPSWQPIRFVGNDSAACGDAGATGYDALRTTYSRDLLSASTTIWGIAARKGPRVTVVRGTGPLALPGACGAAVAATAPSCTPCDPSEELVDFAPLPIEGEPLLVARCRNGAVFTETMVTSSCGRTRSPLPAGPLVSASPGNSSYGWASPSRLETCQPGLTCRSWLLPSPPGALVEIAEGALGAIAQPGSSNSPVYVPRAVGYTWHLDDEVAAVTDAVRGARRFILDVRPQGSSDARVRLRQYERRHAGPVAEKRIVTDAYDFSGPFAVPFGTFAAELARTARGGPEVVVSIGDQLLGVRLDLDLWTPPPATATVPLLETRVVPAPKLPIEGFAVSTARPASGSSSLELAVLVRQRIFWIEVQHDDRWLPRELLSPSAAKAVRVFFTGSRGRVGYSDGAVFSLPDLVPIARPLDGGQLATAYASLCGRIYAHAPGAGLLRLDRADGEALGTWTRMVTPTGAAAHAGAGARLHVAGPTLHVFGDQAIYHVRHDPCPAE